MSCGAPGSGQDWKPDAESGISGGDGGRKGYVSKRKEMSPASVLAFVDESWEKLRPCVQEIYERRRMSKSRWMEVYSTVYDVCQPFSRESPPPPYQACFLIYNRVGDYLKACLKSVELKLVDNADEAAFGEFFEKWRDFKALSKDLERSFAFMNRTIACVNDEPYGYFMHLVAACWRDVVFKPRMDGYFDAVLRLLERSRRGETVDMAPVVELTGCFVEMGLLNDCLPSPFQPQLASEGTFEGRYVAAVEGAYSPRIRRLLEDFSFASYVEALEGSFAAEQKLLKLAACEFVWPKVKAALVRIHFNEHEEFLGTQVAKAVVLDDEDGGIPRRDYADVHKLFTLVPSSIRHGLVRAFESRVLDDGKTTSARLAKNDDRFAVIYAVDHVVAKYEPFVGDVLEGDRQFLRAVRSVCAKLLREVQNPGRLLAECCAGIVRNLSKNFDPLVAEKELRPVSVAVEFLNYDTSFENDLVEFLIKLYLKQAFAGDDVVTFLASKLRGKLVCRNQNLEVLSQDVVVARDFNVSFQNHLGADESRKLDVDYTVHILTDRAWPFRSAFPLTLPGELDVCRRKCEAFYVSANEKKRLKWQYHLSKGEVATNCFRRSYTFTASTFQMCVLLRYNGADVITLGELRDACGMSQSALQQTVGSLTKAGLLRVEEDGGCDLSSEDAKIHLNLDFESTKSSVNLISVKRFKSKPEINV